MIWNPIKKTAEFFKRYFQKDTQNIYEDPRREQIELVESCSKNESNAIIYNISTGLAEKIIEELFNKAIKNKEDIVITKEKGHYDFLGVCNTIRDIDYNIRRAKAAGCDVRIIDFPITFIVVGGKRYWAMRGDKPWAEASFNNKVFAELLISLTA